MSYVDPTPGDRDVLLDFYSRLRASFDRETNHSTTVDLLKLDFDRYLTPENHTEWSPPFPPRYSRKNFLSLSTEERKAQIQEIALKHLQETMDDAALLSHLHNIELGNIDGLEQDSETIRTKIQQERSTGQAKIADY